jgi:GTP diphosphokinase / guanosine-3',5'-bis(diphosphate) 3'-diphosphatase
MMMLNKAMEFANKSHASQTRNNGIPYIVHPVAVMGMVRQWGIEDEEVLSAALLHDVIEDTGVTKEQLLSDFSARVATLVDHLTHYEGISKSDYIKSFGNVPIEALLIKLADRICNVNDFLIDNPAYTVKYASKGLPIIEAFVDRKNEIEEAFGPELIKRAEYAWKLMWDNIQPLAK